MPAAPPASGDSAELPTGDAPMWWPPILGPWGLTGSPKCPSWACAPTRALCSCPVVLGAALLGTFQGLFRGSPLPGARGLESTHRASSGERAPSGSQSHLSLHPKGRKPNWG